jgi:hypothetical protein
MKRRHPLVVGTTIVIMTLALGVGLAAAQGAGRAQAAQAAQVPTFTVDLLWPKPLPNHWLLGSAVGVAVDSRDHVFVINLTDSFNQRTETGAGSTPPVGECCLPAPNVLEFDPAGTLVASWGGPGQGYTWPASNHGIAIDNKDNIWIGGAGGSDAQILKFSHDGKFIMAIGKAGAPAAATVTPAPADTAYQGVGGRGRAAGGRGAGDSTAAVAAAGGRAAGGRGRGRGGAPSLPANSTSMEGFGGPTRISFDVAANEAFVADGARNHRVAVIDMTTGAIKRIWGAYGTPPNDAAVAAYNPDGPPSKQFGNGVQCAALSTDGLVYVCDRQNDRVQVFRKNGQFVTEKIIAPKTKGLGSVWDVTFSRDPQQRFLYVADGANMKVHILDRQSLAELATFGDGGRYPGQFLAVHSIATDSKGNIYTTEHFEGKRLQKFTIKP